jgi:signal transduction histidine kinase
MKRLAVDGLIAAALLVIGLGGTGPAADNQDAQADGWVYALVVIAALALIARRLWPVGVLVWVAVATSAYMVIGGPYGPILLSFLIATYTVARHVPLRPAAVASAVALAILLVHVVVSAEPWDVIPGSAWVIVPFALGVTIRMNRESAARERADQARQYADEERLRVAQEVHDVVGHGLSAINMQAEIALHLLAKRSGPALGPSETEQAEAALSAISRTSREALDELRVTLALVRRTQEGETRAPTPGLARLDDLVARMSESGVPVKVETDGERRDLPAAVDLAAYRVIQESLTNVLRHAGAATATVRLGFAPGEVSVEVTDTGRGADGRASGGHGLTGMSERVAALGGEFAAGSAPGQGFRVYAKLPSP